jgi:hypothetical protein
MNTRKLWALAASSMLAIGIVGVTSAASVTPTLHTGNIEDEGTYKAECPTGFAPISVPGGGASATLGAVTINVTYNAAKTSLDFSAVGGTVAIAYVKGGPDYYEYNYGAGVTSDTNLVAPPNGGDNTPVISHSVYCVKDGDKESEPPSAPPQSEPPSAPPQSEPPSAPPQSEPPSAPPQSEPPSAPPQSEPPSAPPSGSIEPDDSVPPSASSSPEGSVLAETDDPTAPPSDAEGVVGEATATLPLLLIILGVIGLGAVVLTPRRVRR